MTRTNPLISKTFILSEENNRPFESIVEADLPRPARRGGHGVVL